MATAVALSLAVLFPAAGPIDTSVARAHFDEAARLSAGDGGALWGIELYGPMMFVDPATRNVVANQPDTAGRLTRDGEIYRGRLPESVPVANTAVDWGGRKWTMLLWPLPADRHDRAGLLMHECFHRIQDQLGLSAKEHANEHLDSAEGRYLLQLEWRALTEAFRNDPPERKRVLADALAFRRARHAKFPAQQAGELALEMNEGVAEYTGAKLSGRSDERLREWVIRQLDKAADRPTFVRSFAYVTGPAYGLLLDERDPDWRKGLSPTTDLGFLLASAWSLSPGSESEGAIRSRAARYGGNELWKAEQAREAERQKRLAELRATFFEGPVVHIPLRRPRTSFDPGTLTPLDELGTVYPKLTLSDDWGRLTVESGGALLFSDWSAVRVSQMHGRAGNAVTGEGWHLELSDGWTIAPADGVPGHVVRRAQE